MLRNIVFASARAPTALSLALGAPGLAVFLWLGLPLPWLLGPLAATGLWVVFRPEPLSVAPMARNLAIAALGLQIGAGLTPDAAARLAGAPIAALGLVASTVAAMAAGWVVYRRWAGWDPATSFLAAAPGALSTTLALLQTGQGDAGRVLLAQTVRLILLVSVFPLAFPGATLEQARTLWSPGEAALALAAAALLVGVLVKTRTPAAWILGPALSVSALTGTGVITGGPPLWSFLAGLYVVGVATGAKLSALRDGWREGLSAACVGLLLMAAATGATAFAVAPIIGLPFGAVWLAFSPGGFEAMVALAVALDLEPAFVAAAHVARVLGLTVLLPLGFRWIVQKPENDR
ncbi:MAG: AbrB family transcriptional regulator [Maricaulaceae bacterium]